MSSSYNRQHRGPASPPWEQRSNDEDEEDVEDEGENEKEDEGETEDEDEDEEEGILSDLRSEMDDWWLRKGDRILEWDAKHDCPALPFWT